MMMMMMYFYLIGIFFKRSVRYVNGTPTVNLSAVYTVSLF